MHPSVHIHLASCINSPLLSREDYSLIAHREQVPTNNSHPAQSTTFFTDILRDHQYKTYVSLLSVNCIIVSESFLIDDDDIILKTPEILKEILPPQKGLFHSFPDFERFKLTY